jgi:hypothetical protein
MLLRLGGRSDLAWSITYTYLRIVLLKRAVGITARAYATRSPDLDYFTTGATCTLACPAFAARSHRRIAAPSLLPTPEAPFGQAKARRRVNARSEGLMCQGRLGTPKFCIQLLQPVLSW